MVRFWKVWVLKIILTSLTVFFYGETRDEKNFLEMYKSSSLVQDSDLNRRIEVNESLETIKKWIPSINYDLSGSVYGAFDEKLSGGNYLPSVSVVQELPGGIYLKSSVSHGGNIYRFGEDYKHIFNLNPSFGLSVPLIFDWNLSKKNLEATSKIGKTSSLYITEKYKLMERKNLYEFFSLWGQLLYYKKLKICLDDKLSLYEKQDELYDQLLNMGKVSLYEQGEKVQERLGVLDEISEIEESILEIEKSFVKMGLDLCGSKKLLSTDFSDYLKFCKNYYSENIFDEIFSEDISLLSAKISFMQSTISNAGVFPVFSSNFSVDGGNHEAGEFSDFSSASWSLSFSLNFPVFSRKTLFDAGRNQRMKEEKFVKEMEKIDGMKRLKKVQFANYKEIYNNRTNKCKNYFEKEKKRYESSKKLYELGRISELNLEMMKNSMNLAECYFLKSEFEGLCYLFSFY